MELKFSIRLSSTSLITPWDHHLVVRYFNGSIDATSTCNIFSNWIIRFCLEIQRVQLVFIGFVVTLGSNISLWTRTPKERIMCPNGLGVQPSDHGLIFPFLFCLCTTFLSWCTSFYRAISNMVFSQLHVKIFCDHGTFFETKSYDCNAIAQARYCKT